MRRWRSTPPSAPPASSGPAKHDCGNEHHHRGDPDEQQHEPASTPHRRPSGRNRASSASARIASRHPHTNSSGNGSLIKRICIARRRSGTLQRSTQAPFKLVVEVERVAHAPPPPSPSVFAMALRARNNCVFTVPSDTPRPSATCTTDMSRR